MVLPVTLFDLFGDFSATWPIRVIQPNVGIVGPGSPPPNPAAWLGALNNGVALSNIRTGALGDRVSVEAQLTLDNARTTYTEGFPFVFASMPDVEFRIPAITGVGKFVQLFASVSERGAEVVLERLPVEIRLPIGLVEPHLDPSEAPSGLDEITVGAFTAGNLDDQMIIYRRGNPTSIFVHIRLHVTEDGECTIRPAVPISFGQCMLSGMPCLAVHDFSLIPSPTLVPQDVEWIRHAVTPWLPSMTGPLDGLFAVRSVHLDSNEEPFKDVAKWLNSHSEIEPAAEFVLDDVVVPFFSPYVIPIPRHITIGIRRRILDPDDQRQVFAFDRAPVLITFNRETFVGLLVESLFYKSLPSENLAEDLGLTFSAALLFDTKTKPDEGEPKIDHQAIEFGLGENYTLRAGYRRDFSSATGMPAPGTGVGQVINAILHWEIAGSVILDIMAIHLGYSLGRAITDDASFGDSAEATLDIFVSMPPTGAEDSFFKLRSLNGEKVAFAIEGLGWCQGSFHLEGLSLPDGVVVKVGPVGVVIQEIGLKAEQGATYLSFSGGVLVDVPSGFEGGVTFKRLRFRVAGNKGAPFFKLDGFFVFLSTSTVSIEAGGYYTETSLGPTRVREFGLTGSVRFELKAIEYLFGLDLIIGEVKATTEEFDYFMFQIFFRGSVTIGWFELRGARLLFARNMEPKLAPVDRQSQDLRYFNWYKSSNPINVPGDRRLAAWKAQNNAWALGIGVSASIASLGKVLELGVFVLVVVSSDENGFLIVGEVRAGKNPNPLGFFALEWDGKNDRFSLVIGVNLKLKQFLRQAPAWSDNIARLTGTLFISNDPGTFAIGRLADQRTWLSLRFDVDLWLRTFIQFGFCFEYVDGPTGPKGVGLVIRVEGVIHAGIVRVTYNAGFGLLMMSFQTGSTDYAAAIWIEAGLRIVLFGFLHFGLSARAEYRNVGSHPSRGEMQIEIRLETPWFLPDVTWTFGIVFGDLLPADLATSTSPLRSASATEGLSQKSQAIHVERFDQTWNGEGTSRTFSINELRIGGSLEADRLQRFESDTDIRPVATDSTIAIEWSVAVNDQLALKGNMAPNLGNQCSGDLTLKYDLVGIAVRRRARFGADRSWKMLEERLELVADFSDANGVDLSGSFGPQELTKFWDIDVQIGGQPATKKLLLNATTPFEFQTKNPEVDEEVVRENPNWPCCNPERKQHFEIHEVTFREGQPGADIVSPRLFTQSQSRLSFLRPAYVFPQSFSTTIPPGTFVALVTAEDPGPVFRAEMDEDAAFCFVRLAWPRSVFSLLLLAFDAAGKVIGTQTVSPGTGIDFQNIMLPAQGPIRRLEARIVIDIHNLNPGLSTHMPTKQRAFLAIDRVAYIGLRDYLDHLLHQEVCEGGGTDFSQAYEGRGKLFFLPNHDYEVALTTRVTVAHPSKPAESADVKEYVYFKTKGLPGLNTVKRVGEEVEPYVNSAYTGGKGILYREEPVALAFKEDFHVAVPLTLRPPGTSDERTTLLRMQLLVQPDLAPTLETPYTATGEDWIVAHRSAILQGKVDVWKSMVSTSSLRSSLMTSTDLFRARLATLTQREQVQCNLDDPRNVIGPVLIAPPQGTTDPDNPGKQLWPGRTHFTATVRLEGAGFVDRRSFETADATAFSFAGDTSSGESAAWSVADGELRVSAGNVRRFAIFGEPTWNHLTIQVNVKLGGPMVGIGVALPTGGVPTRGLFAVVEQTGTGRRLAIYRRESGVQFIEVDHVALPDPANASTPVPLIVTAFDDRLRASVGDVVLEADRDELREGRLCLVAQGEAKFTSLQVGGLDIYTFPFAVSRFRSFEEHIESFRGTLDMISPNALGSGTTTATTAGLWSATQAEIQAAMQPTSDPTARQSLLDRWVRELGLPLKDEITTLELSRFVVANQTELFLLESPEPLDFTQEIILKLLQRKLASLPREGTLHGPVHLGISETEHELGSAERLRRMREAHQLTRENLALSEGTLGSRPQTLRSPVGGTDAAKKPLVIQDVVHQSEGLRVELEPAASIPGIPSDGRLIFAEVEENNGERRLQFYAGTIERKRGKGGVVVHARKTDELIVEPDGSSLLVSKGIWDLPPGSVVVVTPDFKDILDWFRPRYVYEPVDISIIQDGSGRRAIIIPLSATSANPLPSGRYRMTFSINRQRWSTNDPPDDANRYKKEATLVLKF